MGILSSEIVLHANDIVFVRRIGRVGMLPDFSYKTPFVHTHKAVTLSFFEVDNRADRQLLQFGLFVGIADHDAGASADYFPNFGSAVVVLP